MEDREILINKLNELFMGFWAYKGIDIEHEKVSTNKFNACMMYIYDTYIKNLEITNSKGIKQYFYLDYINIVEWYISKVLDYNFISIYGLALLINRSMEFLRLLNIGDDSIINSFIIEINNNDVNNYNSRVCIESSNIYNNSPKEFEGEREKATALIKGATQKAFETLQQSTVNKLNDTPLGLVTNANNNKDIGLMYAKERIQEQTKARLQISLKDLPMLE